MYVPLAGEVQALCTIVPEWHADTGDGVEDLEAANGLLGVARVPKTKLTVAHAREAGGGNAVGFAHPLCSAILRSWVAGHLLSRLLLAHIPYAQLLVSARGDE